MLSVNIYGAKTRISALIQVAERGEEIVITNRPRRPPRPAAPQRERPVFGSARAAFERSG